MVSWRTLVAVFFLYLGLSLVYTWPMAPNIRTSVPDIADTVNEFRDPGIELWYPWWVRQALADGDKDLLHTNWVCFPHGSELAQQPLMIFHSILQIPFIWLGVAFACNAVLLLSFAFSGLTAFLLATYVIRNVPGALFAGFVYAFCPYRLQHLVGHYNLMPTETLPLVVLTLLYLYDRPTLKRAGLAGGAIALTAFTDFYYLVYAAILATTVTIFRLVLARDRLRVLKWGAAAAGISIVLTSPFLVPVVKAFTTSDFGYVSGHDRHKLDLFSPIVPSERQVIGKALSPITSNLFNMKEVDGIEHSVYLGIALLALCLPFTRRAWRSSPDMRYFLLAAQVFLILAMGPRLGVNGIDEFEIAGKSFSLYLPGIVLPELPLLKGMRSMGRYALLTMLALSVWGGFAVRELLSRRKWIAGIPGSVLVGAAALVLAAEYLTPPTLGALRAPWWTRMVKESVIDGPLAYVPMEDHRRPLLQIFHQRRLLLVGLSPHDPWTGQYYWRHPALRFLMGPTLVLKEIPTEDQAAEMVRLLNLGHVRLSKSEYGETMGGAIRRFLVHRYGLRAIAEDDSSVVFERKDPVWPVDRVDVDVSELRADLHLVYGWSNREAYEGKTVAWMRRPEVKLVVPKMQHADYQLTLDLLALQTPDLQQEVEVAVGGEWVGDFNVAAGVNRLTVSVDASLLSELEPTTISLRPRLETGLPHESGFHPLRDLDHTPVVLRSGGYWVPGPGLAVASSGGKDIWADLPGILVIPMRPDDGTVEEVGFFISRGESADRAVVADVKHFLQALPKSSTVLVAVKTHGRLDHGRLGEALQLLGADPELTVGTFDSFAMIGWFDGRPPHIVTGASEAVLAIGDVPKTADGSLGLLGFQLSKVTGE